MGREDSSSSLGATIRISPDGEIKSTQWEGVLVSGLGHVAGHGNCVSHLGILLKFLVFFGDPPSLTHSSLEVWQFASVLNFYCLPPSSER